MRRNIEKFKSNLTTVLDELNTKDKLKKTEKDLIEYAKRYVKDENSLNKDEVKLLVTLYDVHKGEKRLEEQKRIANDLEYQERQKARKQKQRQNYILGSVFRNVLSSNGFHIILKTAAGCGYLSDKDLALFGFEKKIDFENKEVVILHEGKEYCTVHEERINNINENSWFAESAKQKFYQQFEQSGDK